MTQQLYDLLRLLILSHAEALIIILQISYLALQKRYSLTQRVNLYFVNLLSIDIL